ncbi:MAG TPA: ABC transporter permease [Bacillota bacterium]|nr:ABC transporter permease [Bacillota bacterium]
MRTQIDRARTSAGVPGPQPGAWAIANLRAVRGRAFVRVVALTRDLPLLPFETVLPVMAVAAYVYLYRYLGAPPGLATMVLLGGVMITYWQNVLWAMASQLYWERMNGNLELYMLLPTSRVSILLGMALGGMFATTVRAMATLGAGLILFRVPFILPEPLPFLALALSSLVALYGLGMMLSSLFLMWGREAWHLASLFQEPIDLLSGVFFPVRALGPVVAGAASLIPLTLALDGMRQILVPGGQAMGFLPLRTTIAILAAMAIVFPAVARVALNRVEHLAKREGRITARWQ